MSAAVTSHPSERPASPDASEHGRRRLGWALLGVCVAVTSLHLLVGHLGRDLSWDEAIYVSQVRLGADALEFSAHRARGIVVAISPVAWMDVDPIAIRLWLAVVVGAGTWAAFYSWIPTIGAAAPLAATGYAATWFTLTSQSEIYPNALTALGVVATMGWALRAMRSDRRRDLAAVAAAVALTALLRPADALLACAGIAIALVLPLSRSWGRLVLAMLVGGLVGSTPWLVEMIVRFGGLSDAIRSASGATIATGTEVAAPWRQYLDLLDGPMLGPIGTPRASTAAVVAVVLVAILVVAGWWAAWRRQLLRTAVVATAVASVMAGTYLFGTSAIYIRFMLPAWGALSPLMALGAMALLSPLVGWGSGEPPRGAARLPSGRGLAVWTLVGMLFVSWMSVQLIKTWQITADLADSRASSRRLGELLAARADGRPCAVSTQYGWPQVAFYSGCDGARLLLDDGEVPFADSTGYAHVYAAAVSEPEAGSLLSSWRSEQLEGEAVDGWTLYSRPR